MYSPTDVRQSLQHVRVEIKVIKCHFEFELVPEFYYFLCRGRMLTAYEKGQIDAMLVSGGSVR